MAGVPEGGYNLLSVAARTWEMFEGRRFDGSWQCGGALWPGTPGTGRVGWWCQATTQGPSRRRAWRWPGSAG
jgi:hypothetical protein